MSMEARHVEAASERWELAPEILRGAELALRHKLRRRLSADFISRNIDDLMAQAAKEYVDAIDAGMDVRNVGGFLVDVAYKRALDALDKESREPLLDELEAAVPLADPRAPQPLEEVERSEQRSQLYEAVARLDPEERRVLALVHFEGLSGRDAAEPLGVSESTSLRRLRSAHRKLREWLPAIEEGRFCDEAAPQLRALSQGIANDRERIQAGLHLRNCASCRDAFARRQEFAFEVGLAAWLSATTAQAQMSQIGDQLIAAADSARHVIGGVVDRGRDIVVRLLSSGGGEAVTGAASGPLAKTAAACTAAAAACALTGVVGPGLGGVDLVGGKHDAVPKVRSAPAEHPGRTSATGISNQTAPPPRRHESSKHTGATESGVSGGNEADRAAGSQFGLESLSGSSSGSTDPQPVTPSGQSPDQAAQQQFGLP